MTPDAQISNSKQIQRVEMCNIIKHFPGVLANDSDVDVEDTIIAELLGTPVVYGTLSLYDNGSFTYDPNDDYYGTVYFTYRAYDGLEYSEPVMVSINVKQSNLPPLAVADEYFTNAGVTLNVLVADGVLDNDSDPDGDALEAQLVDGVSHGLLTLRADGSFVYVPNTSFVGVDSFRYRAFDELATSNEVVVAITVGEEVNMAPVAMLDSYVVRIGVTLSVAAPGVLANDYDVNGDSFTAQLGTDVSHGDLTLHSNGSFEYSPDPGYIGVDTFTYRAYDGELYSSYVTVTITTVMVAYVPMIIK